MRESCFVFIFSICCSTLAQAYILSGFIYKKECSSNSVSVSVPCEKPFYRKYDQIVIELNTYDWHSEYNGAMILVDSSAPPNSTYRSSNFPIDNAYKPGVRKNLKLGAQKREFEFERISGDAWGKHIVRISLQKNGDKRWILKIVYIDERRGSWFDDEYFFHENLNYDNNQR